ncbi:NAD(P)H-binding protein [Paenibacillus sp.]|uniref:NAD(P)H-binding protein n=1 Tax=Paenibacillus sp. TaxID=58172 RepID=UPI002D74AA47|nr:NAD(P)H-binding protein [Paenibacillus sp.]HZG55052.1 NAD(P)H-binding protein [Paenibacillus sp.]
METKKKAVLLGATGLVGRRVLERLLASPAYERVTVVSRRALPARDKLTQDKLTQDKLTQVVLDDLAAMDGEPFEGADDVFCALGTTIRQAGTQARFREVDYEYPVAAARLAAAAGAQRYVLVSSMGADPSSKIFYSRVKGETEAAVRASGVPMISIVRPSLLLGEREQFRLGERIGVWVARPLMFAFAGPLRKYRPIEADDVAAVMVRVAQMFLPGTHVYENDQLHRMAPNS